MKIGPAVGLTLCALGALGGEGCRNGEPAPATPQAAVTAQPTATAEPRSPLVEAPRAGRVKVKTPDGSHAIEIEHKGRDVEIAIIDNGGSRRLLGEERETGKRKYGAPGGAVDLEVRPEPSGFKLRTSAGVLLWKVKIDADKIKVSDNDENRNAWALKTKYDDKVKVVDPSDAEVGEVRFYRDRQKVKVKDASGTELFESNTTRYSAAFGVLLMRHVPAGQREIIMAEILARSR